MVLKRNDTRPALVISLKEGSSATAINLTTATSVRLLMKSGGTNIARTGSITNAAGGIVTFTLQSADTATSGSYTAEVEITWNDGGIETVPNDAYLTVTILDDLA